MRLELALPTAKSRRVIQSHRRPNSAARRSTHRAICLREKFKLRHCPGPGRLARQRDYFAAPGASAKPRILLAPKFDRRDKRLAVHPKLLPARRAHYAATNGAAKCYQI